LEKREEMFKLTSLLAIFFITSVVHYTHAAGYTPAAQAAEDETLADLRPMVDDLLRELNAKFHAIKARPIGSYERSFADRSAIVRQAVLFIKRNRLEKKDIQQLLRAIARLMVNPERDVTSYDTCDNPIDLIVQFIKHPNNNHIVSYRMAIIFLAALKDNRILFAIINYQPQWIESFGLLQEHLEEETTKQGEPYLLKDYFSREKSKLERKLEEKLQAGRVFASRIGRLANLAVETIDNIKKVQAKTTVTRTDIEKSMRKTFNAATQDTTIARALAKAVDIFMQEITQEEAIKKTLIKAVQICRDAIAASLKANKEKNADQTEPVNVLYGYGMQGRGILVDLVIHTSLKLIDSFLEDGADVNNPMIAPPMVYTDERTPLYLVKNHDAHEALFKHVRLSHLQKIENRLCAYGATMYARKTVRQHDNQQIAVMSQDDYQEIYKDVVEFFQTHSSLPAEEAIPAFIQSKEFKHFECNVSCKGYSSYDAYIATLTSRLHRITIQPLRSALIRLFFYDRYTKPIVAPRPAIDLKANNSPMQGFYDFVSRKGVHVMAGGKSVRIKDPALRKIAEL